MKKENILIYFAIIILLKSSNVSAKQCFIPTTQRIGRKIFCESHYGVSTSCWGAPFPVKKAYVICFNKYHNDQNIPILTVDCLQNGEWSEEISMCLPECDDTNDISFDIIIDPKNEYPKWYAEILKLGLNDTIEKIYPAVILSERRILTKKENLENVSDQYLKSFFKIRIPRLNYTKSKEYAISRSRLNNQLTLIYGFSVFKPREIFPGITTVVYLNDGDYIIFDDVTLPICDRIYPDEMKTSLKLLSFNELYMANYFKNEKHYPYYPYNTRDLCFVPQLNKIGTEVACFESNPFNDNFSQTECISTSKIIVLRCKIGYEQKINPKYDYIDKCCFYGERFYDFGEFNDCKLVCGEINTNHRPKHIPLIHKGNETHNGFAPWHVAIYFKENRTIQQICGGSLIHSNIILSAGHCFYNYGLEKLNHPSNFLVGAGKFYRLYERNEESEHYSNVKSIHIPETYEEFPMRNDISVLILDHHIKYTLNIKPVCIDFTSFSIPGGLEGRIVGWGAKSVDDNFSNELLTANLTTLTNSECKVLVGSKYKAEISNDKFCAINEKGSSACQGDSGGGFVVKKTVDNVERYFLLGIISSGISYEKYCSDGFTTVFTNIRFYKDFIQNITNVGRSEHFFEKHFQPK